MLTNALRAILLLTSALALTVGTLAVGCGGEPACHEGECHGEGGAGGGGSNTGGGAGGN